MKEAGTRPRGMVAGAVLLSLLAALPTAAPGQWLAEVAAGGVSHESAGAAISTSNALAGIRYEGPEWLYLSAGLPLDSDGLPWAAFGAGARLARGGGPLEAGIDLGGHAHGYRAKATGESGGGVVLDALPFVALPFRALRLEARSGISHYSSRFAGHTISRTGHDSGLSAELRPIQGLSLAAEGRLFRAQEDDYPYVGLAAEMANRSGSLWAFAGRWTSDLLPDAAWGVGASVRPGGTYSARVSFQQQPVDPLFWNETRRFWSLAVSRRLGRPPAIPVAAAVLPEMRGDHVVFRIPVDGHPAPPSLAGDFNGWSPVEMRRSGDHWVVAIPVPAGVHHYSFRAADGTWFLPDSVENRVDDGFGGVNGVLVVPARER